MALFVAAFVVLRAAASGATLLALDFLYPGMVDVSGLGELLLMVALASLASVLLFDIGLDGLLLRALRRLGLGSRRVRVAIFGLLRSKSYLYIPLAVIASLNAIKDSLPSLAWVDAALLGVLLAVLAWGGWTLVKERRREGHG